MKDALGQKILVVDDKPENLYVLEKLLQPTQTEIIKATSGNEALIASLHHEFALAILDVQMPIMDGFELAEYLRSTEKTRRLPIIFLTAVCSDETHIFKGYEAGAVDFITKPYPPTVLLSKVEIFLQLDRQKRELLEKIELEQAKRYLEDILLTMTESVMVVSRETTIRTVNGACSSLLGYQKDEIIGMPIGKILPDEESIDLIRGLESSETKEFRNRETFLKDRIGQDIAVLLSGATFFAPSAENLGAVLVARDIRERKAAEDALRASEVKYRALFEGMPVGLYRGTSDGRLLDANETLANMLGYPNRESLLAVGAEQLYVDPSDRMRWRSMLDRHGVVQGFEMKMRRLDGQELWVAYSAKQSHDPNVDGPCYEGSVADISERKQAAERIRHLNSVLRAIRDVNQLIVREKDEDRLIQSACDCLTATRGFYSAWIVLLEQAGGVVKVAESRLDENHRRMADILKKGEFPYCAKQAMAQPGVVALARSNYQCAQCPMEDESKDRGIVAQQLRSDEQIFGVLMVSLPIDLIEDEDEQGLLAEVAEDIAFALNHIASEQKRQEAEVALQQRTYDLGERVKELNCLFQIAELIERPGIGVDEILQGAAELIPPAFQHPQITCARVVLQEREYRTSNFEDSQVCLTCPILLQGKREGFIEACLLEEKPDRHDSLFLKEEQGLINTVAERLGHVIGRKKAENALRESEERYRLIFERAANLIVSLDNNGMILTVNRRVHDLLGYSSEELIGQSIESIIHPDCLEKARESLQQISQNGYPFEREYQMIRRDGLNIDVSVNSAGMRDESGKQTKSIWIFQDVTERNKAQKALATSEAKYRDLVQNANSIILRLNREAEITFINEYAQQYFGYSEAEILGQSAIGTILFDGPGGFNSTDIVRQMETNPKRYSSFEAKSKRRTGEVVWISWTNKEVRDSEGRIIEILCIGNDQTARRNLERQLQQAQKMEAIGTLAGGIAHDFNNILGIILGYTEMTLICDEAESGFLEKNLNEVIKATHRAKDLVQQILAFARQSEQECQPVQVSLIVKEALKMLRASLPTTIEINQAIDSVGITMSDPTQIHQVIMNLCTNAHHAMREHGGILEVTLKNVDLNAGMEIQQKRLQPGPYIKLTVSDTGHGIDAAVVDRIFDPYFTTKPQGEGTGLGLSVVHGIVKGIGGAIEAKSTPGKGSTFEVFLPRIERGHTKAEDTSAFELPRGRERILVVEDEDALLKVMAQMVERLGYKAVLASSSVQAFDLFRENADGFDLVVTDQTMPQLTGAELAKKILMLRPDIPVIICTGFSDLVSREIAEDIGIREFIMKPITIKKLAATFRRVLDAGQQ